MLTLHHLSDSRSQRTLWLLEELGLPYRLVRYQRVPETMAAPPEMKALHPIGKAPILEDEGRRMVESGAITQYILSRYGDGGLAPAPTGEDYMRYLELLEIGVASGMTPVLLSVYARMAGLPTGELDAAAEREYALVLGYLESILAHGPWLLGNRFSAADIQASFVPALARFLGSIAAYPNIVAWLERLEARPAFRATIEKGGPFIYVG
ncbi:glutathione S-transferase family protein [Sphingomonas sp. CGMCC 1.13654]|uniref:glutathione transferase n=1 Tax=Sphingomonas chungangi TaxID=2683589 RepID=A0A838L818_9SPHN|nr:glutathione S-transferase family protein [Sphingomonas chungangi]MBA2933688.1 glutathione S-transferase family protein [Sphingomonas chungangi]MVW55020.1 glutathione S-transferase [Sphingomonas chungangi]